VNELVVTAIWITAVIWAAFNLIPPAMGLGELSRIAWFHIPVAWICVLAFGTAVVCSIRYLKSRDLLWDDRAVTAAEIGLLFAILATVSGSMWAKKAWGVYWNWDPRESSIVILLLIYGAYFALRSAVDDPERRGVLAGAYNIIHPDPVVNSAGEGGMATGMILVLNAALIGQTLLFSWIFGMASRIRTLKREVLHG